MQQTIDSMRSQAPRRLTALALGCALYGCAPALMPEEGEAHSGGDTSVVDVSRAAFSLPAKNLSQARRGDFFVGNAIFNRNWVTAPSSTTGLDGLGPTFNASSCAACHFKDGRGRPPVEPDEEAMALLFRLSVPGEDAHGGPLGDPAYGTQLNPRAILGVPPEGTVRISRTEVSAAYPDGTTYSLEVPSYALEALAFGPAHEELRVGPRVAPGLVGLGLLEALPEAELLARADPDDTDGDGVSGRPNWVWDAAGQKSSLGRFGWKANQPSLAQQNADAFWGDIGITSWLHPEESCPAAQEACHEAPVGDAPQVDEKKLRQVLFYTRTLAVPVRREVDAPEVLEGRELFHQVGCASCHVGRQRTGELAEMPELSNQVIYPYTDLLLHDMGEALADGRPDFQADGREWRTPPLWGIGLVATVNRHTRFLHDGRARSLEEAVLWHGGEAEGARTRFAALAAPERARLLRFLESL